MRHALWVILLFVVGSANAATIVYSSPNVVTSIGGLDIGGTLYNVDFEANAYSTFGGDEEFWINEIEAASASDAINVLFVSELVFAVDNTSSFYYQVIWGGWCSRS
jgi:hypothetical protein